MKTQIKKLYTPLLALMAFFVVSCVVDEAKVDDKISENTDNVPVLLCKTTEDSSGEECENPSIPTCKNISGDLVEPGTKFEVECNTCECDEDGNVACTEMACETEKVEPAEVTCNADYSPVCGYTKDSEFKTFSNECVAKANNAYVKYEGECEEAVVDPEVDPKICTKEYVPVCAKTLDGELETYSNLCEANADKAVKQYLGECLELVVDPIFDETICTAEYAPVCAYTEGGKIQTFGNACQAEINKATVKYEGECQADVIEEKITK